MNLKPYLIGIIIGILISIGGYFAFKPNPNLTKLQIDEVHKADLAMFNEEKAKISDSIENIHKKATDSINSEMVKKDIVLNAKIQTISNLTRDNAIMEANAEIKKDFKGNTVIKYDTVAKQIIIDSTLIGDYNV